MHVSSEVTQQLDFERALHLAAETRGELLPARLETMGALATPERVISAMQARLRAGVRLNRAEIVFAARGPRGVRPAADVSFFDRAVLAAFADLLQRLLAKAGAGLELDAEAYVSEEEQRDNFERAPLEDENAGYIAITDIASFYDLVDHKRLSREIVELTANPDLADATREALSEVVGRGVGLPQGPHASDILADFYLNGVDRGMLRRGIASHRLNDDFYIPSATRPEALSKLVELESLLREIGLILNYGKTRIPTRRAYEAWLDQVATKRAEIDDAFYADEEEADELTAYGFDADVLLGIAQREPTQTAGDLERLFREALSERGKTWSSTSPRVFNRVLPRLASVESDVPLTRLDIFLDRFPHLVRHMAIYLRALEGNAVEDRIGPAIATYVERSEFYLPWVVGWLLDPLARSDIDLDGAFLTRIREEFLFNVHVPWFVRGRAAIVLSRRGFLPSQEEVAQLYAGAPPSARAELVAAVQLAHPPWQGKFNRSLSADEPIARAVVDLMDRPDRDQLL